MQEDHISINNDSKFFIESQIKNISEGLKNIGNNCYSNSVLQCLFNCTIFEDFLLSDIHYCI